MTRHGVTARLGTRSYNAHTVTAIVVKPDQGPTMAARDWFESIAQLQQEVNRLQASIESAYASAGPHGQSMGSVSHGGGSHDSMAPIDRMLDSDAQRELERVQGLLRLRLDQATDVLYGKDSRGGLAKARGSVDADILWCRYCDGWRWAEIAAEFATPDSKAPAKWAMQRALRALRYIDRVGMESLADWDW